MKNTATMDLTFIEGDTFSQFVENNMSLILKEWNFSSGKTKFFQSSKATPHSLQESFENLFLIIGQEKPGIQMQHLSQWAEETGKKRARNDFPIYHSLEVLNEFRDIFWRTLRFYLEHAQSQIQADEVFELERYYNHAIDFTIHHFSMHYAEEKKELARLQEAAAKEPTMPVITLTHEIGLLTLIGSLNRYSLEQWMEETIHSINQLSLMYLIIDISHATLENHAVFQSFLQKMEGFKWLGCQPCLTGVKLPYIQQWMKQEEIPSTGLTIFPTVRQALDSLQAATSGERSSMQKKSDARIVKRERRGRWE